MNTEDNNSSGNAGSADATGPAYCPRDCEEDHQHNFNTEADATGPTGPTGPTDPSEAPTEGSSGEAGQA